MFRNLKKIFKNLYQAYKQINSSEKKLTKQEQLFHLSFSTLALKDIQWNNGINNKLLIQSIGNYEEYLKYFERMKPVYYKRQQIEKLLATSQKEFSIKGFNPMINQIVDYKVNYDYCYQEGEQLKLPNYRESLICSRTTSNSRMRATFLTVCNAIKGRGTAIDIYLTEQVTYFYSYFKKNYKNVTGSEFLGTDFQSGEIVNGIRHEDVTNLSFKSESFDLIICLEVLEHVPNYKTAFKELYRSLRKDGIAVISVPFVLANANNTIRAVLGKGGEIEYLLEPEYHGDPVNPQGGILCFQHFGWAMLDELREVGFKEVKANFTWSIFHGILGEDIMILTATK